jgi:hypothetical protein
LADSCINCEVHLTSTKALPGAKLAFAASCWTNVAKAAVTFLFSVADAIEPKHCSTACRDRVSM